MRFFRVLATVGPVVAATLIAVPGVGAAAPSPHPAQLPVCTPGALGGFGFCLDPGRVNAEEDDGAPPAEEDDGARPTEEGGETPAPDDDGLALTPGEQQLLNLMDPKDRARYLLQKRMQEVSETAALLGSIAGVRHATAMQVINNIR
jgi:hypothetical protein